MKTLKLLSVFVGVVGILAAIFFVPWSDIFNTNDTPTEEEQKENFQKIHKEIVDGWEASDGWDKDLYDKLKKKTLSYETASLITHKDAGTLLTTLKEHAINKVCSTYDTLLPQINRISADAKLILNYAGLMYIKKDQDVKEDVRISNVSTTHNLYIEAKRFVKSSPHYSGPNFDCNSSPMWRPLSAYQTAAISMANSIKNNSVYYKISHIEDFKSGLSSDHINSIFNNVKATYYEKLKNHILSYFQRIYDNRTIPADEAAIQQTATNTWKLQTAIAAYKREYGSASELMLLKNKFDDYINSYKNEQNN